MAPSAPPAKNHRTTWHVWTLNEVFAALAAGSSGLSEKEAARRLVAEGRNELRASRRMEPLRLFFAQFKSIIIIVLIAAALMSWLLSDWIDCAAILGILLLNALIGFYQEFHAERAIAALKSLTAPHANVLRDGRWVTIAAAEVVAGDVISLNAGDVVPADARLLEASSLQCMESALTGESEPSRKRADAQLDESASLGDRSNIIYMGTDVSTGSARAIVIATGAATEIGQIASLIEEAEAKTPLQKRLEQFGRSLVGISLAVVGLLFLLGLWRGNPPGELVLTSVSLAVAAVPESLPAIVTISLSLGVQRMARRGVLIRKLPAVETLGSATVICTDKTGTLTRGEMTVRQVFVAGQSYTVSGQGYAPVGEILREGRSLVGTEDEVLIEYAKVMLGGTDALLIQNSDGSWVQRGDPTEGAMVAAAGKLGLHRADLDRETPVVRDLHFDITRKNRIILRSISSGKIRVNVNGAPDVLIERCNRIRCTTGIRLITREDKTLLRAINIQMAAEGLRVIATAFRDVASVTRDEGSFDWGEDLVFIGLTGMQDVPRSEAMDAVLRCRSAGVRAVMITGDHPVTALAIARQVGLAGSNDRAVTGTELDSMSDSTLHAGVSEIAVFARVTAAHKLRIIRAWRANGAVVAMTGDGINDAPAVKGADIGIAMGRSGTEVTRQAADMVITDDNFATIVAAVEEGRGVDVNIRKTLRYLLASNSGELLVMAACVISGFPSPLLPIHLLWINLVTDSLPALCLASDAVDQATMCGPPRLREKHIASRHFLLPLLGSGVLIAAVALAAYLHWLIGTQDLNASRTVAFNALIISQLFLTFSFRSDDEVFLSRNSLRNIGKVALVVALSLALQIACHSSATIRRLLHVTELSLNEWIALVLVAMIPLAVREAAKITRRTSPQRTPRPFAGT